MAEFHNAGYKGLYNGETADDIFKRKKLRYREDILDNMNEDELVANLFRINQTKQRSIRDNVQGEKEAKDVHYEVGKKVRKAIADIGGMMPEEMPTPKNTKVVTDVFSSVYAPAKEQTPVLTPALEDDEAIELPKLKK